MRLTGRISVVIQWGNLRRNSISLPFSPLLYQSDLMEFRDSNYSNFHPLLLLSPHHHRGKITFSPHTSPISGKPDGIGYFLPLDYNEDIQSFRGKNLLSYQLRKPFLLVGSNYHKSLAISYTLITELGMTALSRLGRFCPEFFRRCSPLEISAKSGCGSGGGAGGATLIEQSAVVILLLRRALIRKF